MIVYDVNETFKLILKKKVVELVCKGEYEWAALSEQISDKVEETIVYKRHNLYVSYNNRMRWFRICWLNCDWSIMQGGVREIESRTEFLQSDKENFLLLTHLTCWLHILTTLISNIPVTLQLECYARLCRWNLIARVDFTKWQRELSRIDTPHLAPIHIDYADSEYIN
jgi:hypothetical protein